MADRNRAKGFPTEDTISPPDVVEAILAEPMPAISFADAAPEPDPVLADPVTPDPVTHDPVMPPPPATKPAGSTFFPALGGGVLAAILGFGLAYFDILNLAPPVADNSVLIDRITRTETALATAQAALATMQETVSVPETPDPDILARLAALESDASVPPQVPGLENLTGRLDAFEAQLASIAAMPADGSGASAAALAALQSEMRALKATGQTGSAEMTAMIEETKAALAKAQASAEAMSVEATAIVQTAQQSAALTQLRAALDSGQAYSGALAGLGDVDIPPAIADHAATGLPTLASLQSGFPEAARLALETALRADMGDSWSSRVGTFLRSQTGARSLTPREGSDPDAVLSRAEASLASGDLDAALTEIATLPPDAVSAMADWTARADRRRAAVKAVDDLTATLAN